jgi:hypothetical protein
MFDIQHCLVCRPSDSTVSEDAGIEPRTVATMATMALAVRRSNHSARSHPLVEAKMCTFTLESTPFIFTTPNLALTHTKRITVFVPEGRMELGFSSP